MASVKVPLTMCTSFIDQNLGGSDEVMCKKCWEMKDHVEMLISELKSTQLIIKLLQEDINLASTGTRNQANLTDPAEHNTRDELRRANEESCTWKEVGRTRATAARRNKYMHTYQMETDSFPLL